MFDFVFLIQIIIHCILITFIDVLSQSISLFNSYISLMKSLFNATSCAPKSVASCTIGVAFISW